MKKTIVVLLGMVIFLSPGITQDLKTEVYDKINIPNKVPAPYFSVQESDVMWSKVIFRMLDLREKMNLPLYFPTQPIGNRMNLVTLLLHGIDNHGLPAYDAQDDLNEFKFTMTKEQVDMALGASTDTITVADPTTGVLESRVITTERRTDEIKQVLVKEKWYFDKNHSTMQVRVIGLCPIRVYNRVDEQGIPTEEVLRRKTFWIYYPEARPLMASYEIFNRHNDAQTISFDDLFLQRRFSSYIFAETNVYNNRPITSYSSGLESLYESERIKEYLFTFEHDLWEY